MSKLIRVRLLSLLIAVLCLTLAVAVARPELLVVSIYKISLIATAAYLAYWADRWIFPYARPGDFMMPPVSVAGPMPPETSRRVPVPGCERVLAAAMLRRAVIVAGGALAAALGA